MIFSSRDRPASSSSRLRRIAQADPSATESPTCSVAFSPNSEAVCEKRHAWGARAFGGILARRPPSHISSRNGRLYPVRSCAGWRILAALRQQAPPRRSWHWGAPKAAWAGHQSVQGTVIKLPNTKGESAKDGQPSAEKSTSRCRIRPACLRSKAAIAAGQIEGKAVDQFHFLGKITAEIRGTRYANRTRVGCRLGGT